jgi:hypothetical protein
MATLHVLCARCGYDAVVVGVRTVAGARCPGCGDRAVELTDLAPERDRTTYLWGAPVLETETRLPAPMMGIPPAWGCFAPGTVLPRVPNAFRMAIDRELLTLGQDAARREDDAFVRIGRGRR